MSRLRVGLHPVKMDCTSHLELEWISHAYWMSSLPCSGVLQWSFSAARNALAVLCEQMCPWPPPNAVWAIRSQMLLYSVFWKLVLHLRAFHSGSAHLKMHFTVVLNRTKGWGLRFCDAALYLVCTDSQWPIKTSKIVLSYSSLRTIQRALLTLKLELVPCLPLEPIQKSP